MLARADAKNLQSEDLMVYCVSRLDHLLELVQRALELLACPACQCVLSEKAFRAVEGFITERKICLSPDTMYQLTFIKMNQ